VLVGQAKGLVFENRWESQKFVLAKTGSKATEIKVLFDDVHGGPDSGDGV